LPRRLQYGSVPKSPLTLFLNGAHSNYFCDIYSRLSIGGSVTRFLSSNSGSDSDSDSKKKLNEDDPFGVYYQDGESTGRIGPKDSLPPNYIRDGTTRKFTGKVRKEISTEDAALLKLSPLAKEQLFSKRVQQGLDYDGEDLVSSSSDEVARRIREEKMALNTLGRKVADVTAAREHQIQQDAYVDDSRFFAPLSESEMLSLKKIIDKNTTNSEETDKGLIDEAENLIPSIARKSSIKGASSSPSDEKDNQNPDLDLDLEWMSATAQRSMTGVDDEEYNPFASLMPSDLNPARKVNRKNAKPIPKELLHHNNLSLLRRYITPGGQIMNRVQSRLSAKDQRKIAKLIKRARHLGFIPHIGQWKVEDHGNIKENDILYDREWEKRLLERGLVQRQSSIWKTAGKDSSG